MVKVISFTHEGAQYIDFDVGDEEVYAGLCKRIGKEALDCIIARHADKPSLSQKSELEMMALDHDFRILMLENGMGGGEAV